MKPIVTLGMISYNRPLFLKEAVKAVFRQPGIDNFEFLLWDNNCNEETKKVEEELLEQYNVSVIYGQENIGLKAIREMSQRAQGKYYVHLEEDMLWFSPDWLKNLIDAFETEPRPSPIMRARPEWGIMATNVLQDEVNNGGLWPVHYNGCIKRRYGNFDYLLTPHAAGGAMLFNTEALKEMNVFPENTAKFNKAIDSAIHVYVQNQFLMANLRDTYIYHAASPFYNQLYPAVWSEKQLGQDVMDAFAIFQKQDKSLTFEDKHNILNKLKNGEFSSYAEELFQNLNHRV